MASTAKYFVICAIVLLCFAQFVQPKTISQQVNVQFFGRLGEMLKKVAGDKETVKELWDGIGGIILPKKIKDLGDIAGKVAGII